MLRTLCIPKVKHRVKTRIEQVKSTFCAQKTQKLKRGKRHCPEDDPAQGSGKWTDEEHRRFLQALELYGNCWKKVEEYVRTRSCAQIRSHCQKYFRRMRNKTLQELKRTNQLHGKVFIVTKEYFNYAGCSHPVVESELRVSPVQTASETCPTKLEEQKESFRLDVVGNCFCQEQEADPRFEFFEEPRPGSDLDEGFFNSAFNFCEEAASPANEVAFAGEYEERGYPFLARVPYEA